MNKTCSMTTCWGPLAHTRALRWQPCERQRAPPQRGRHRASEGPGSLTVPGPRVPRLYPQRTVIRTMWGKVSANTWSPSSSLSWWNSFSFGPGSQFRSRTPPSLLFLSVHVFPCSVTDVCSFDEDSRGRGLWRFWGAHTIESPDSLVCTTTCGLAAGLCFLLEVTALISDGTLSGTFSEMLSASESPSTTAPPAFAGSRGNQAPPALSSNVTGTFYSCQDVLSLGKGKPQWAQSTLPGFLVDTPGAIFESSACFVW